MKYSMVAALTASAVLAMISVVSAQNVQPSSDTSRAGAARPNPQDEYCGLTPTQEDKIPYRACTIAVGWVNGHLVCRDR